MASLKYRIPCRFSLQTVNRLFGAAFGVRYIRHPHCAEEGKVKECIQVHVFDVRELDNELLLKGRKLLKDMLKLGRLP